MNSNERPRGLPTGGIPRQAPPPQPPSVKRTEPNKTTPEENKFLGHNVSSNKPSSGDDYFSNFFNSDEEDEQMHEIRQDGKVFVNDDEYAEIDTLLSTSLKRLRETHPMGGLPAFQFITTDILMKAPKEYFLSLESDVQEITNWVQTTLADKGKADLVGDAVKNPLDAEMQDKTFRMLQGLANEYAGQKAYRGIRKNVVVYLVIMDIMGFSRIEPLWRDRRIDEIICNGPSDIQIEISGRLISLESCQFRDAKHLELLLERIYGNIGKTLSRTTPLLNGRLYDNSRIFSTDRSVSPEGPNVAIRRHPEKYWTPMDLIEYDSGSKELFTEIGNMIHKGCSYIVIGGTGSGKTSLLNATSGFFDPDQRVLTLEDDLELKLNPNKRLGAPMECREPNPNQSNDKGVTMRDLVKASLRLRPDGIVIGEVRDGAMFDLCQALNTGHWGCSTVHANSPFDGIYRMQSLATQSGLVTSETALPLIAAAFDFIIMQERFGEDGTRKITSVCEIDPYPERDNEGQLKLGLRDLWKFVPQEGLVDGKVVGTWEKVGELSDIRRQRRHLDLTPDLTWPQLVDLCKI